jgi:hypothetical protein
MADGRMDLEEGIFWIALTVFGTGLYLVNDLHLWGGVLIIIGIAGLVYSMRHEIAPGAHRMWIILVAMAVTVATVGVDIYQNQQAFSIATIFSPKTMEQSACDDTRPRIRFARNQASILVVPEYILIRPSLDPGQTTLKNVEIEVERVDRWENGEWKWLNADKFPLEWADTSTSLMLPRLAGLSTFALINVSGDGRNIARLATTTKYGSWNGDFSPFGQYRIGLKLSGDGVNKYFSVIFRWFGSMDTFDLDGACPNAS